MRDLMMRLHQALGWMAHIFRLSNTSLSWAFIVLLVVAFLLPYLVFPSLFDTFESYGSVALLPLCIGAYLQSYRGTFITWGMIVIGIAFALWLPGGLSWSTDTINNYVSENIIGLFVGLAVARLLQLYRQRVTTRLSAQAQVQVLTQQRELNALKDQLILNLSHELRTPLTTVQGYLELLDIYHQQLDETRQATFLLRARTGCAELGELLNNLFDIVNLEQQREVSHVEPILVARFVQEMLDHWDRQMRQDHELVLSIPDELAIQANPQYLQQVLRNLLSNAIKFSPPHSRVVIHAGYNETEREESGTPGVCICIQDC